MQSSITYDANTSSGSNPIYTTTFTLNGLGQMTKAAISDGKYRQVTFSLDEVGQIIRRDEERPSNAPSGQTGSPHEVWYRFGDREWGYAGNNGSTIDVSTDVSIAERRYVAPSNAGTFRGGRTAMDTHNDFTNSVEQLNSHNQGSRANTHTVRGGETLQSIAQSVYGDSSLWYKIAQANGLSGAASLSPGQQLQMPAGVVRSTYNASSYTPYDPGQAIGDLSPTTPAPPKKGCGALGIILLAAIAIAVTVVTAGAALSALGLASGGIGGGISAIATGGILGATGASIGGVATAVAIGAGSAAVGSIVSQGVGVATGIQEKFSWKSVGLAAISGGFTAGLGQTFGEGFLAAGARGALANVVTQGIGTATGLQDSFDFAGVAAAGVGAAVGFVAGEEFGSKLGGRILSNTAGAIANAATRSAINGESFGDNLKAAIPDAIGTALGSALAGAVQGGGSSGSNAEIEIEPPQAELIAAIQNQFPELGITLGADGSINVSASPDTIGEVAAKVNAGGNVYFDETQQKNFHISISLGRLSFGYGEFAPLPTTAAGWGEQGGSGAPVWVQDLGGGRDIFASIAYGWDGEGASRIFLSGGADPDMRVSRPTYASYYNGGNQVYEDARFAVTHGTVPIRQYLTVQWHPTGVHGVDNYLAARAGYENSWNRDLDFRNRVIESRANAAAHRAYVDSVMRREDMIINGAVAWAFAPLLVVTAPEAGAGSLAMTLHGTAIAAEVNQIGGLAVGLAGGDRLPVDYIYNGASTPLNLLAVGGNSAYSLSRLRSASTAAESVPLNTRVALQGVTDRAVAELAADPSIARRLMSPGSYNHLVEGTRLAPASYGKAVERLSADIIRNDPALSSILSYQSRPFRSTPDFIGYEGYNMRSLDITTAGSTASHAARPYGSYTEIVTHPGLPSNLVFPR